MHVRSTNKVKQQTDKIKTSFNGDESVMMNKIRHAGGQRPPRVIGVVVATLQPARHVAAEILQVDATHDDQFV